MAVSPPSLVRRFAANPRGRDLVVGDVHGCFSKLRAALAAVGFNPDAGDRLFALGDLVDRGPESDQALWWLSQPWFASVLGNHEQMALLYAANQIPAAFYAQNGGAWFLGMTKAERLPFVDAFYALPVAIELETAAGLLGLVHADCPAPVWDRFTYRLGLADGPQLQAALEDALWSRSRITRLDDGVVEGVRAVLVGHTPVERVTSLGNVFFLDTGAWLGRPAGGDDRRPFAILDAATLAPAFGSTLDWSGWN